MTAQIQSRPRTRFPVWAIVLMVLGAITAAAVTVIALVALGIVGAGVAAHVPDAATSSDRAFKASDDAGWMACQTLAMHLDGIGSFDDARTAAATAATVDVRAATTAAQMRAACVAAGAKMP